MAQNKWICIVKKQLGSTATSIGGQKRPRVGDQLFRVPNALGMYGWNKHLLVRVLLDGQTNGELCIEALAGKQNRRHRDS